MNYESATSSLVIDLGRFQRSGQTESDHRLVWTTAVILAITHFGIALLGLAWQQPLAIMLHSSAFLLACGFGVFSYLSEKQRLIKFLGVVCILAGMIVFLFGYPGPQAIVVFIVAPIPAFRVLGIRFGSLATVFFFAISVTCLFASEVAVAQLRFETRINILIAFGIATAFGALFEHARERMTTQLNETLDQLKAIKGLVPVCAACKKIRDLDGSWHEFESLLRTKGRVEFSHGFCEQCATEWISDVFNRESAS